MYKFEVVADNSGEWCSNSIVYNTLEEAEDAAIDLASRWTLVRKWRVRPQFLHDFEEEEDATV
jgi:hypothetical protein